MADIAFLLLIFFLVTTTISADKGILRKLPAECPSGSECSDKIAERNVLRIALNKEHEILIEDEKVEIEDIQTLINNFIDNNGMDSCDYCNGPQDVESSDHPNKAVISLSYDALTKYDFFIRVQDEITKGFYDLRANYAKKKFNKSPENLSKTELQVVKKAYPFVISEIQIKRED